MVDTEALVLADRWRIHLLRHGPSCSANSNSHTCREYAYIQQAKKYKLLPIFYLNMLLLALEER